jgi:transposase
MFKVAVYYESAIDMHNEGMTHTDIGKELDVHKSTISRWINKAKSEGKITK